MFTGIIESQAVLMERKKAGRGMRLGFHLLGKKMRFRRGESVAVDGACLTISDFRGRNFAVDVIPETFRSTTLGGLESGQRVNLERALRLGDRLGGHFVSGHIDGMGRVQKMECRGKNFRLQISVGADIIRRLIGKGSIAIDGISFTLQEIQKKFFVVGVTPHTFRATTLPWKRVGDAVNLETDYVAKLVHHFLLRRGRNRLTEKALKRQGF